MPLLGVPFDPNDMLSRILAAARDLVALAVLRGLEPLGRAPIRLLELLRASLIDAIADVLDDHLSAS